MSKGSPESEPSTFDPFAEPESGPPCDGWCDGKGAIAMIGDKGYVYCRECGTKRRQSGYERVRLMRPWELRWINVGKSLPSYTAGPEPKGVER